MKRFASGPLHGGALGLYFILVPFVVVDKWRAATSLTNGPIIRILLVGLSVFWLAFFVQVLRHIGRLRRGESAGPGGSAWLAGLVVATAAVLLAPGLAQTPARAARAVASSSLVDPVQRPHRVPTVDLSPIALAVAARRRRDALRESGENDDDVDSTVALLRRDNPHLLSGVNHLLGCRRDGVVRLVGDYSYVALEGDNEALCVLVLGEDADENATTVSFAREGGRLRVPTTSTPEGIMHSCVAAHRGGSLRLATTEAELLRHLATRNPGSTLVLYDGPPVDAALAERSVLISRVRTPRASETLVVGQSAVSPGVRVELLRAEPAVVGLVEPFTATLRRRCVEMVSYLALHRHEPVTGDRLRTRVLAHADADASLRTLANTASSVRRALGDDETGPRLRPVSSAGLYLTHGVDSDVEEFHRLVAEGRANRSRASLVDALSLVQGEPLASALRGFEWFLAEGHWARLLRDGEWAALALSRWALDEGDVDLAFWAIERGRLLDPYSDALASALATVPRLREFGGDGAHVAQDGAVGARRAVVTRGPGGRLGDQIVEQSRKG